MITPIIVPAPPGLTLIVWACTEDEPEARLTYLTIIAWDVTYDCQVPITSAGRADGTWLVHDETDVFVASDGSIFRTQEAATSWLRRHAEAGHRAFA
jgi:hypothetical protein